MSSSSSMKIDAFCPVGIGGTKGIDTTYLKLFVGGLTPNYSSKDLYDLFSKFGTIRESVVIPDRFRVRSRCYGFVTFSHEKSVQSALKSLPIVTQKGDEVTVVLASTNTKPRRAHFNVKHGVSGHKPLPTVNEEEETTNRVEITMDQHQKKTSKHRKNRFGDKKNKKVGVYTDPSLFRTANIQQIAPAQFNIGRSNKKKVESFNWPNEDIKKDYHDLKKVAVSNAKHFDNRKSWKLIAVEKEPEKESYHSSYDTNSRYYDDEIQSVKSREWTPIPAARNTNEQHNERCNSVKYNKRRNDNQSKRGYKNKWNAKKYDSQTLAKDAPAANEACSMKKEAEKEDDALTITSSVFEGMYQTEFGFAAHSETNASKNEMDELRAAFRNKMQCKIGGNGEDKNVNGMWGAYEPVFSVTNLNEYNFQNMAPTPPILPIQPVSVKTAISADGSMSGKAIMVNDECANVNNVMMNNMNGYMNCMNNMNYIQNEYAPYYGMTLNSSVCNVEQPNVYYNANYFYANSVQSVGNSK